MLVVGIAHTDGGFLNALSVPVNALGYGIDNAVVYFCAGDQEVIG